MSKNFYKVNNENANIQMSAQVLVIPHLLDK